MGVHLLVFLGVSAVLILFPGPDTAVVTKSVLVHGRRAGRENLFEYDPKPVNDMKEYLDRVSKAWDGALARLKSFVETEGNHE